MTIGETRTRYRVYDRRNCKFMTRAGGWTTLAVSAVVLDDHAIAFRLAHGIDSDAFESGKVIVETVRFRRVASKTARELVAVKAELAAANEQNERLAAALRIAITQTIPQEEKADFLRVAMGREPVKEGGP